MRVGYVWAGLREAADAEEAQADRLRAAGCVRIFQERLPSANTVRPQMRLAWSYMRPGDELMACSLDRVARSPGALAAIGAEMARRGLKLLVLDGAATMDVTEPGFLRAVELIAAMGDMVERDQEEERAAIEVQAQAQASKPRRGRKALVAGRESEMARLLRSGMSVGKVAEQLGVSRATAYRNAASIAAKKSKAKVGS